MARFSRPTEPICVWECKYCKLDMFKEYMEYMKKHFDIKKPNKFKLPSFVCDTCVQNEKDAQQF